MPLSYDLTGVLVQNLEAVTEDCSIETIHVRPRSHRRLLLSRNWTEARVKHNQF